MQDFQKVLNGISTAVRKVSDRGTIASYIPELSSADPGKFGMCLLDASGRYYSVGDADEPFSIQSISKVLALAKAFAVLGEAIWERVDVEPSGDPFNDLSLLEQEQGVPRNPLINAGALVICDILVTALEDPKKDMLKYVREVSCIPDINYDPAVAASEKKTGFRNYAAAYLIKSFGNLHNDVEPVLDLYFHLCSIRMSCHQLARAFYPFMNRGRCLEGHVHLEERQVKRMNALMLTCGFYDEAGEFAFEIGMPGKSGVGGGIVALLPGAFTVATWSPGLNPKGNSKLGMQALELLTTETGLSIF